MHAFRRTDDIRLPDPLRDTTQLVLMLVRGLTMPIIRQEEPMWHLLKMGITVV